MSSNFQHSFFLQNTSVVLHFNLYSFSLSLWLVSPHFFGRFIHFFFCSLCYRFLSLCELVFYGFDWLRSRHVFIHIGYDVWYCLAAVLLYMFVYRREEAKCVSNGYATPETAIVKYPKRGSKQRNEQTTGKTKKGDVCVFVEKKSIKCVLLLSRVAPFIYDTIDARLKHISAKHNRRYRHRYRHRPTKWLLWPMKTNKSSLIDQNHSTIQWADFLRAIKMA